jgi:hypothetical protein
VSCHLFGMTQTALTSSSQLHSWKPALARVKNFNTEQYDWTNSAFWEDLNNSDTRTTAVITLVTEPSLFLCIHTVWSLCCLWWTVYCNKGGFAASNRFHRMESDGASCVQEDSWATNRIVFDRRHGTDQQMRRPMRGGGVDARPEGRFVLRRILFISLNRNSSRAGHCPNIPNHRSKAVLFGTTRTVQRSVSVVFWHQYHAWHAEWGASL